MKQKQINFQYNIDEFGEPVSIYIENEIKQVSPINYCVQLNQIPDEFHRLVIEDDSENILFEVFGNDVVVTGSFKVNYANGIVWFNSDMSGKNIKLTYYGRGIELINASRIVMSDGMTLEDKISKIEERLNQLG